MGFGKVPRVIINCVSFLYYWSVRENKIKFEEEDPDVGNEEEQELAVHDITLAQWESQQLEQTRN